MGVITTNLCTGCGLRPREAYTDLCAECIAAGSKPFVSAPKPRYSLLPWAGIAKVVDVLTVSGSKYSDDHWRSVSAADHLDKALRHIAGHMSGETRDHETKLPALAHAAGRLLMFLALDNADTPEVDDD